VERAAGTLKAEWPVEAPAESFAQWTEELRREARVRGSAEDCMGFSESLKQPQAALRQLFAPSPGLAP
jgi:hypothetical protein